MAVHRRGAALHRAAEDRLVPHQLAAHAPPLRPLPAHDEGDARRVLRARREGGADLHAVSLRWQKRRVPASPPPSSARRASGDRDDDCAARRACKRDRAARANEPLRFARSASHAASFAARAAQRLLRARREDDRPRARPSSLLRMLRVRMRRALREDDVRIRAAETEGIDADQALARRSPGNGSTAVGTRSLSSSKSMCGLGVLKCRLGGIAGAGARARALTRPATPAAVSRWPRFVLHEPIGSGSVRRAPAERFRQRVRLDRVADRRAGAVRLDEADLRRIDPRIAARVDARAAPALRGSAARCRWCGRPD